MALKATCRQVFKDEFGVNNDDDFVGKESADPADVREFEACGYPRPDENNLIFDFKSGPRSDWNAAVVDILVEKLRDRSTIPKSDAYLVDLVEERYGRIRLSWKRSLPRTTDEGVKETPDTWEDRILKDKELQLKNARRRERRKTVSLWSFLEYGFSSSRCLRNTSDE
jgi:hypothetical protein